MSNQAHGVAESIPILDSPPAGLLPHLPLIRRVVRHISRRERLSTDDELELFSDVCVKLLEHDSAVLRRFRGESSLQTYLCTVASRVMLDRRIHEWGKYRPTAKARALGEHAVRLERLVLRDRLTPQEAIGVLTNASVVTHAEAVRLCAVINPTRRQPHVALDAVIETLQSAESVPAAPASEVHRRAAVLRRALARAVRALSPADRELLRRRYADGVAVVDMARGDGVNQKRLYRRCERVLARLRVAMERANVHAEDVHEIVGHALVEIRGVFRRADPAVP